MPKRPQPRAERAARSAVRWITLLPPSLKRLITGKPVCIDGQQLDLDIQLGARLLSSGGNFDSTPIRRLRSQSATAARIHGDPLPLENIRDITIPGPAGEIPARLYRPTEIEGPTAALVYYHGGGWTLGDLDAADAVARFLAHHAALTVISIDYRLAPEHPFPAGLQDAIAAFNHVAAHPNRYGIEPEAIGVGGESAGGNLAAVVTQQSAFAARTNPVPIPAFQLLLMPVTDLSTERPSHQLFSSGPFLTNAHLKWFRAQYLTDPAQQHDPRVSPLLSDDLRGLPPAYIATAGFDILRDEGEAYAHKLATVGVPVVLRRHSSMAHGMIGATSTLQPARDALHEAAAAIRVILAFRTLTTTATAKPASRP
ncbi:Carboxylesterase NlhH [Nocardia cerradoensis]|uniref:Carboxylesterase NlhH n=1 Tax=Nocardia cerradoensis TaxID=85688 RepID=A0A231H436_9NOCA|nr:Carboxylesterase NlhH [Nocardia cerradoensis]